MRVVMMTNTFTPHVGGVARSVELFSEELRRRGHEVLVVAPEFPDTPEKEENVVRIPAIQHFNGSDFSFPMPVPTQLRERLDALRPQLIHSHHPFLLGDTALRVAAERGLPVVFTHHTMYERYTHYVPGDSPAMKRAAVELAVGYSNLCDAVIAPSESAAEILRERGVEVRLEVIPTGVLLERFADADGAAFRHRLGIPADAFVVGHLGRLAPEKNLALLAEVLVRFLTGRPRMRALLVGEGPSREEVQEAFSRAGLAERLHTVGRLEPLEVGGAYAAMDVFLFTSKTETQGMVVTEAMAAGTPVAALDASGVREVVEDGANGRLVTEESADALVRALEWIADGPADRRRDLAAGARRRAEELSLPRTADRLLDLYSSLRAEHREEGTLEGSLWQRARARLAEEWKIALNVARAVGETLRPEGP